MRRSESEKAFVAYFFGVCACAEIADLSELKY